MKTIVSKKDLMFSLNRTRRAITARTIVPILRNVLLKAELDRICLVGTDTEIEIRTDCPAKSDRKFEITVPSDILTEIVASLSTNEITLQRDEEKALLKVIGGRSNTELLGLPADQFPQTHNLPSKPIEISGKILKDAIIQTVFAASTDESRAILTGVLFGLVDGGIRMAATNTHRLVGLLVPATQDHRFDSLDGDVEWKGIIPARTLTEVARMVGPEEFINMRASETRVEFQGDDWFLASRLIEGQFPYYERIIPTERIVKITADREVLMAGFRRCAIVSRSESEKVVMDIAPPNTIRLSSESADIGKASEEVEAQVEGEALQIAFNAGYVMEGLNAAKGERVTVKFNGPLSPTLWQEQGIEDWKYVVMPMQIL